jgi:hypothetical protein
MIFLRERIYRQSRHDQVRRISHCLILANQGVKVAELQRIFDVSYKIIYSVSTKDEV